MRFIESAVRTTGSTNFQVIIRLRKETFLSITTDLVSIAEVDSRAF